ncbi:MAG: hypothetical protein NTX87_03065, partial [Planctomycetota bacterium]|nr:hypothetical protein [Planctomycetota bacterium]
MAQDKNGRRHASVSVSVLILALWMPGCSEGPSAPEAHVAPAANKTVSQSAARPPGPLPTFFELPIPPDARRIAFLIDASGRMTCPIELVKPELMRCLCQLREGDEFHVIFYSSNSTAELPERKLVHATEANKIKAFESIDGIITRGENDPTEALKRSFALGPDAIYLLTGTDFDKAVVGLVRNLNAAGNVKVYTIAFIAQSSCRVARDIASQNGGLYKFVPEFDLPRILAKTSAREDYGLAGTLPRAFFGIPLGDKMCKVVFICDRSGSMRVSLYYAEAGIGMCIGSLSESDAFGVLFMNCGQPQELPSRQLLPATEANKQTAYEFMTDVTAEGETNAVESVRRAFALDPDTICLLTDRELDKSLVGLVKSLNAGGKVKVHAVAFLYET